MSDGVWNGRKEFARFVVRNDFTFRAIVSHLTMIMTFTMATYPTTYLPLPAVLLSSRALYLSKEPVSVSKSKAH